MKITITDEEIAARAIKKVIEVTGNTRVAVQTSVSLGIGIKQADPEDVKNTFIDSFIATMFDIAMKDAAEHMARMEAKRHE